LFYKLQMLNYTEIQLISVIQYVLGVNTRYYRQIPISMLFSIEYLRQKFELQGIEVVIILSKTLTFQFKMKYCSIM
jgi:hypothetical protein